VLAAEFPNLLNRCFGTSGHTQRFLDPEEFCKRGKFGHPGKDKTPVAAGGATPADVLFENDDFAGWFSLFDTQSGPQTDETSADNGDVRPNFPSEGWSITKVICDFLQPE
jgi:hypothetical protein